MDNFKHLLHRYSTLKKHWSQEVVLILVLTLFPHVRNKRVDTNDHKDFSFFLRLFGSKDRKNFYNMLCWEKDKLRKGLLLERREMKNFFKKVRSIWRKKEIQRGLRQVDNKKGLCQNTLLWLLPFPGDVEWRRHFDTIISWIVLRSFSMFLNEIVIVTHHQVK